VERILAWNGDVGEQGKGGALTRIEKTERHPQKDIRLRERIEALESLPEPQRNHLVEFLDALLSAHSALRRHEGGAER
jgi:hypothetical protein